MSSHYAIMMAVLYDKSIEKDWLHYYSSLSVAQLYKNKFIHYKHSYKHVPGLQWTCAISASEDPVDTNLVRCWSE